MSKLSALTEEFNQKYYDFIGGCDAVEKEGKWDLESNGEMEVFFGNDISSVILRLIASDGNISSRETEYLKKTLGFDYTVEELQEVYDSCKDEVGHSFDEQFENGISMLRSINGELADSYKALLMLLCDIIAESDDVVTPQEADEIRQLRAMFE